MPRCGSGRRRTRLGSRDGRGTMRASGRLRGLKGQLSSTWNVVVSKVQRRGGVQGTYGGCGSPRPAPRSPTLSPPHSPSCRTSPSCCPPSTSPARPHPTQSPAPRSRWRTRVSPGGAPGEPSAALAGARRWRGLLPGEGWRGGEREWRDQTQLGWLSGLGEARTGQAQLGCLPGRVGPKNESSQLAGAAREDFRSPQGPCRRSWSR